MKPFVRFSSLQEARDFVRDVRQEYRQVDRSRRRLKPCAAFARKHRIMARRLTNRFTKFYPDDHKDRIPPRYNIVILRNHVGAVYCYVTKHMARWAYAKGYKVRVRYPPSWIQNDIHTHQDPVVLWRPPQGQD